MDREFQVGDEVEFAGVIGKLTAYNIEHYPFLLEYVGGFDSFTKQGYLHSNNTGPRLKLIKPVKKTVVKKLEFYVNIYQTTSANQRTVFKTRELADADAVNAVNRSACVKLTGEYQTEEDT